MKHHQSADCAIVADVWQAASRGPGATVEPAVVAASAPQAAGVRGQPAGAEAADQRGERVVGPRTTSARDLHRRPGGGARPAVCQAGGAARRGEAAARQDRVVRETTGVLRGRRVRRGGRAEVQGSATTRHD